MTDSTSNNLTFIQTLESTCTNENIESDKYDWYVCCIQEDAKGRRGDIWGWVITRRAEYSGDMWDNSKGKLTLVCLKANLFF